MKRGKKSKHVNKNKQSKLLFFLYKIIHLWFFKRFWWTHLWWRPNLITAGSSKVKIRGRVLIIIFLFFFPPAMIFQKRYPVISKETIDKVPALMRMRPGLDKTNPPVAVTWQKFQSLFGSNWCLDRERVWLLYGT